MPQEEWQITGTRISSRSNADVYYGDKTVRIPGEVMVSYFLADPYEMFWLEKEDREIWPWDLPEEKRKNKLSETEIAKVMETVNDFFRHKKEPVIFLTKKNEGRSLELAGMIKDKQISKRKAVQDMNKILYTKRLILRRWNESDAESLYEYAKDPDVGPIAGWPPHKSVEESTEIIKTVFSAPEAYAVCLKEDGRAIGAIELILNGRSTLTEQDDECELGYWLGKPFWGKGLIPEAAGELLRYGFEDLGMRVIWCGYYDGNVKSRRVQEKCGFRYQRTDEDVDVAPMNEKRTVHVSRITKEEWLNPPQMLYT